MRKTKTTVGISLLLTLLMLVALPATALADPVPVTGLPDSSLKGTLTVHKFAASAESDMTGTGAKITDTSLLGSTLPDVGFTLYKITDKSGDERLTKLLKDVSDKNFGKENFMPENYIQTDNVVKGYELNVDEDNTKKGASVNEPKTNSRGMILWDELEIGYYVLKETTRPEDTRYQTAATTIITIPMGAYVDGAPTSSWNYDVHVYPKNVKENTGIRKEIVGGTGQELNVGAPVEYIIETMTSKKATESTPKEVLHTDTDTGSFKVTDILDNRLTFESADVYLMGGTKGPHKLSVNVLPTAYASEDVELTKTTNETDYPGKTLYTWELKDKGKWMKQIIDENIKYMRIELTATVNDTARTATTDGDIYNATTIENRAFATIKWADASKPDDIKPDPLDPKPDFELASVTVIKRHWQSNIGDPFVPLKPVDTYLNGAKFKIAAGTSLEDAVANAKAGKFWRNDNTFAAEGSTDTEKHQVVTTGGGYDPDEDPIDTPDDYIEFGLGSFVGLDIDSSRNNFFVLVEVEAPAGYVLSQSAWPVTIYNKSDGVVKEVEVVEISDSPLEMDLNFDESTTTSKLQSTIIDNQMIDDPNGPMPEGSPTFKLPKTGGMGTVLFIVVGAMLVLVSIVLFRKSRKEEETQNS